MTIVFLGLLVLAWGAVVMPALSRARQEAPLRSAERFSRGLASIAPPKIGAEPVSPAPLEPVLVPSPARGRRRIDARRAQQLKRIRRKRAALAGLLLVAIVTGIAGFAWSTLWMVHLLVDIACATYCGVLVGERNRRLERRRKVRRLPARSARVMQPARVHARRA